MTEYWEITHDRAVPTQAVWGMQTTFELNKLTRAQHLTLCDSLPILAQARDNAENNLTDSIAAKNTVFTKIRDLAIRVPGVLDGMLDDEDELKDQLDAIFAIDAAVSENHTLRRCRLLMPFWTDVNAARAAAAPPKAELTVKYLGADVGVGEFNSTVALAIGQQKNEAEKQRLVTNAKSALRTADGKTDRANKRWYQAWLKAFPAGTPEGDAALSDVPTEQGTPAPSALEILSAVAVADHTVHLDLDPAGGAHATTKELQYLLPGEADFGHSTAITGTMMTAGPFTVGASVSFRTRVANSNPGTVTSATKTVVVI